MNSYYTPQSTDTDNWQGPGYYAGCQVDTYYNGSPRFKNYLLSSDWTEDLSKQAHELHLGTPRWCETRIALTEGRYAA